MSVAQYGPGILLKNYVCVEVDLLMTQTSVTPVTAQSVELNYTNAIGQTIVATVSVSAPHTITPAGLGFTITTSPASPGVVPVTVSFDKDFSGDVGITATSMDNTAVGLDRLCNFSIGTPIFLTPNASFIQGCVTGAFGDVGPKSFEFRNIIDQENFNFEYSRSAAVSAITLTVTLQKRKIERWIQESNTSFRDPETNTLHNPIPTGVEFSKCEDENKFISWFSEHCAELSPLVYEFTSPTVWSSIDAVNQVRPRTDGAPGLFGTVAGNVGMEFNKDGTKLYSLGPGSASISTQTYDRTSGILGPAVTVAINNAFLPVSIGAPNFTGLATNSINEEDDVYVVHRQIGPNIVHIIKINPITGISTYVGNTGINWLSSIPADLYDLTFSANGTILYSHGQTIYLIDPFDGQKLAQFSLTVNNAAPAFATGYISRLANGDILVSGQDTFSGHIWILDGENFSIKSEWNNGSSLTPPVNAFAIANPFVYKIPFQRIFRQDLDTGQTSYYDKDIEGKTLIFPYNTEIKDCGNEEYDTWMKEFCYRQDSLPENLGDIVINQIGGTLASGACNPFTAFVPPGGVRTSFTHSVDSNTLYTLNAAGDIQIYPWTTKTTPGAPINLIVVGIPIAETDIAIRTKWDDGSMWYHTQEIVGTIFHRFYKINLTTGTATLQGTLNLPGPSPLDADGSFTWGLDGKMYFLLRTSNTGGGIFSLYDINTTSTTYTLGSKIADIASQSSPRVTTNISTGLLAVVAQGNNRIEYYNTAGDKIRTCSLTVGILDYLQVPEDRYYQGTSVKSLTRVFSRNTTTGNISYRNIDTVTGRDLVFNDGITFVSCNSISQQPGAIARFQVISGVTSWSKAISAPNAKSITITRISNNITINDGISGAQAINAAASFTWAAPYISNNLIVSGTAAGSSFSISWIE